MEPLGNWSPAAKETFHTDELAGDSTVLEPDLTIVHKVPRSAKSCSYMMYVRTGIGT